MRATFTIGLCLLLLAGCCTEHTNLKPSKSKYPSLAQALAAVENNVRQAGSVTLSDFETAKTSTTNRQARIALRSEIQFSQCMQKTANPLLPVISGAYSLSLQGAITKGSQESAQASWPWGISAGYQYQISTNRQQQLTVPVTFVSALELGRFYFAQQATEIADMKAGKATVLKHLRRVMDGIDDVAKQQVDQYATEEVGGVCKAVGKKPPIYPVVPQGENIIGH